MCLSSRITFFLILPILLVLTITFSFRFSFGDLDAHSAKQSASQPSVAASVQPPVGYQHLVVSLPPQAQAAGPSRSSSNEALPSLVVPSSLLFFFFKFILYLLIYLFLNIYFLINLSLFLSIDFLGKCPPASN